MNTRELLDALRRERINPRFYSIYELTEAPIDEQCVLQKHGDKWIVYYFERGEKNSLNTFDSEDEAYRYFLDWVLRVPDLKLKQE